MSINQRSKGSKGENLGCKVINTWTNKKFSRVPRSGGLSWNTSNSVGDITCTVEGHYCPFVFEVKTYAKTAINFAELLYKGLGKGKVTANVFKFWEQVLRDSKKVNKVPMLMLRYNGLPKTYFFIFIPTQIYLDYFKPFMKDGDRIFHIEPMNLTVFGSNDLMQVSYKKIRKKIKLYLKSNAS